MYGLVRVLEDARVVDLLFADKEQAASFVQFVEMYMAESGAGNGYGAYWHFRNEPIAGIDTKIIRENIRSDLIENMCLSICDARKARKSAWQGGEVAEPEYMPRVGEENGTITFSFDPTKFPPRIQPNAGDLVRIVDNETHERGIARVKELKDGNVVLIPCSYSHIKEEIVLSVDHVMKIHDFLNGK